MTLGQKQRKFARNVALLIQFAEALGYAVTFGEAWRSRATARANAAAGTGIANSLHSDRLAVDLNLFQGATYLTDSADHEPLGKFWKTLHPLNRWGGDFSNPDGNHYSMSHGERA